MLWHAGVALYTYSTKFLTKSNFAGEQKSNKAVEETNRALAPMMLTATV
jgi:hypothetical protein